VAKTVHGVKNGFNHQENIGVARLGADGLLMIVNPRLRCCIWRQVAHSWVEGMHFTACAIDDLELKARVVADTEGVHEASVPVRRAVSQRIHATSPFATITDRADPLPIGTIPIRSEPIPDVHAMRLVEGVNARDATGLVEGLDSPFPHPLVDRLRCLCGCQCQRGAGKG